MGFTRRHSKENRDARRLAQSLTDGLTKAKAERKRAQLLAELVEALPHVPPKRLATQLDRVIEELGK